jgi:hypothetical protein
VFKKHSHQDKKKSKIILVIIRLALNIKKNYIFLMENSSLKTELKKI